MLFLLLIASLALSTEAMLAPHSSHRSTCFSNGASQDAVCGLFVGSCPAGETRRTEAYWTRVQAAHENFIRPVPCHINNGDEERYAATRIASFSKGLAHDALGHVVPSAYDALLKALSTGSQADFEAIPLGGARKFVNPQAGRAFDLEGGDSHSYFTTPAPAFASAQQAAEIVENYWMAITRDVPFADYGTNPLVAAAAADLASLSDYRATTTQAMLFRGSSSGCSIGPYLSQFLYMPLPFGANYVEQKVRPLLAGEDFMTTWNEYLAIQNGARPTRDNSLGVDRRYMITGRDLSHWVHVDVLFQAYFHAMLYLVQSGAPVKDSNPYFSSRTQDGFGTFGGPAIATLVAEPAARALKAVWFQKWYVHRRLRPEVFAARVDRHLRGFASYPLHPDVLRSAVLARLNSTFGSYLLPMAFPEGSPVHPSYGSGHATVAGACSTVLKAWFNESFVLPSPVVPSPDGQTLLPYTGPALTVGNELNKVAWNVAIGRNIAGVHWYSDAAESLKLGEQVAISLLRDMKKLYPETQNGWTFTSFAGDLVTV